MPLDRLAEPREGLQAAELARDLRRIGREQLVAGRSDEQIVAYLTARYGDFGCAEGRGSEPPGEWRCRHHFAHRNGMNPDCSGRTRSALGEPIRHPAQTLGQIPPVFPLAQAFDREIGQRQEHRRRQ